MYYKVSVLDNFPSSGKNLTESNSNNSKEYSNKVPVLRHVPINLQLQVYSKIKQIRSKIFTHTH